MNHSGLQDLIDQALAVASQKILSELSRGYSDEDRAREMVRAVKELTDALQAPGRTAGEPDLRMPNYEDPWIALAYAQWYQLRQIHLAYSLVTDILDIDRIRQAERHQVLETGCGSLAFAIGLAVAVAERLEQGPFTATFRLHGYDHSSLLAMGIAHWSAIKARVETRLGPLSALSVAMSRIQCDLRSFPQPGTQNGLVPRDPRACRWMVAQHIAYETNQDEVKRDLTGLFATLRPHIGFVTGPSFKTAVVDHINPFNGQPWCQLVDVTPRLFGKAEAITKHRVELAGDYSIWPAHLLRGGYVTWGQPSSSGAPYALRYLRLPER